MPVAPRRVHRPRGTRRAPRGPVGGRPAAAARSFARLLAADWEWRMREYPAYATVVGDPRYDDRFTDLSLEAFDRRARRTRAFLRRLEAVDRRGLEPARLLDHDLLLHETRLAVEGLRFREELMPLTQMHGVQHDVADLLQIAPRRTPADLDHTVARLERVGTLVDQTIVLLREGLARGLTPPRAILRTVPDQIARHVDPAPEATPIARIALADLPADLPEPVRRRYRSAVRRALERVVIPAYRRLHDFVRESYLPRCRESLALTDLPDGRDWYAYLIRLMSSTDLTPRAIHALGLREVARLRTAMTAAMREAGHRGDLASFLHHLRTDPRFFFDDREKLLVAYRDICKRIDAALPRMFRTLPRLPYGVAPVPAYSEKEQTTAYYYPGSPEAGRPGIFYANTYDLASRPSWEMESLAAHEAVPGHHLQIALAQELEGLPAFRRHGHHTAFVEGWGLYAESLGAELGLYRDPHSAFGRLTYEMWRAIRLVVDTGLHAFGWSRERAIAYFESNAGKAGHDIGVEVDRYIAWPAQALAYKIGELKIRELRERSRRALGARFDLRAFHDAVLLAGPLPLPVLERRVDAFLRTSRGRRHAG